MGWQDAPLLDEKSTRWQDAPIVGDDTKPQKIGKDAFPDALRETLKNAPWWERNLAAAGTSLDNMVEGIKQFGGQENQDRIKANNIIREEAPVGSIAGDIALTAAPFGVAGKSIPAAAAVGMGYGLTLPVEANNWQDVARGKSLNAGIGAATGAGGQWVANKATGWLADKTAQMASDRSKNAPIDATIKEAVDAGYVIPPGQVKPTFINRQLESMGGKIATQQMASSRNQVITDGLVRKALGLPDDAPLTKEAMQSIRNQAYQKGYEPVASFGQIQTDKTYKDALSGIVQKYQGAERSFPGAADDSVMNSIMGKEVGASPAKYVYIDNAGNVLKDVKIPQQPKLRNLLDEVKKAGGINTKEIADLGIDKATKSHPALFRKDKGMSMDRLVEWMDQNGWMTAGQVDDLERNGVGGSHEYARDMLRSAFNKEEVIHPGDFDSYLPYMDAIKNLDAQGVKRIKVGGREGKVVGGVDVESFDSGDAIKMIQILRDDASTAFAKGEKGLGKAKREAASAIEDQIERALFRSGKDGSSLLKGFKESRTLMAKAHDAGDAIREGTGNVKAGTFAAKLQRGKPLTGELETIGKFSNSFPNDVKLPAQMGTPDAHNLKYLLSAVMGAGGVMGSNDPYGAALGAIPLLSGPAARTAMFSRMVQSALANPSYNVPVSSRMAGGLLGYSPVGGTVLGLNALGQ